MRSAHFSLFLILSLLYSLAHLNNAAPTCGTVDQKAISCATFATGKDARPKPACCSGLQALARMVKTVNDKKAICRCLKSGLKSFPGVQDRLLGRIPSACKIKVGFPVSINTNCETIR